VLHLVLFLAGKESIVYDSQLANSADSVRKLREIDEVVRYVSGQFA